MKQKKMTPRKMTILLNEDGVNKYKEILLHKAKKVGMEYLPTHTKILNEAIDLLYEKIISEKNNEKESNV